MTSYFLATQVKPRNIDVKASKQLEQDVFLLANTYMDGLGWQPLSGSTDCQQTWRDIKVTLFEDGVAQLTG